MQIRRTFMAAALTIALVRAWPFAQTGTGITAVRAGMLIDGTGSAPVRNAMLIVENGRLMKVGPGLAVPPGARTIDLSGRTVLPGFIDAHTHVSTENGKYRSLDRMASTGADYALVAAENARRLLMAGFTTIRDLGGFDYADLAVKRAIDRGAIPGPRMLVALSALSISGGHGDPMNGLRPNISLGVPSGVADGTDAVRTKVRELVRHGADVIKFAATGGGMSRGTKPTAQHFTDEEMRAIVEEAHRLGLKVAAHAHGTEGIKAAVRAGVDSIEHGIYLDEEACRLMIERGTYFVPTLWITDAYFDKYKEWRVPDYAHAKISAFVPRALESTRMAIRMGVKIAVGTDAGVGEHELAGREFQALVKYGMSPMDAIRAGTSLAADLLGLAADIGTLEAGKLADLVAVDGDPLADIRTLETVPFVMKGGVVMKDERTAPPSQ